MPPWYTPTSSNSNMRWRPFLSPSLKEYLERYWAIMFTVGSRPIETGHIRHYVSWYCTRMKVVQLDHHLHANSLRQQLIEISHTPELPLLFVNKQLIGTLHDVEQLEQEKKLKDVLHFGFKWKVGNDFKTGNCGGELKSLTGALPAAYGDTELFRGRYRGAPVARPVITLPMLHPFDRKSGE